MKIELVKKTEFSGKVWWNIKVDGTVETSYRDEEKARNHYEELKINNSTPHELVVACFETAQKTILELSGPVSSIDTELREEEYQTVKSYFHEGERLKFLIEKNIPSGENNLEMDVMTEQTGTVVLNKATGLLEIEMEDGECIPIEDAEDVEKI